jgi:hypothetical protein
MSTTKLDKSLESYIINFSVQLAGLRYNAPAAIPELSNQIVAVIGRELEASISGPKQRAEIITDLTKTLTQRAGLEAR